MQKQDGVVSYRSFCHSRSQDRDLNLDSASYESDLTNQPKTCDSPSTPHSPANLLVCFKHVE